MLKIIIAIAFVLGFVLGFGLSTLLTLLMWFGIGLVIVCGLDVAAGLSQRACALRVKVREWLSSMTTPKTASPVRRKTIWINI